MTRSGRARRSQRRSATWWHRDTACSERRRRRLAWSGSGSKPKSPPRSRRQPRPLPPPRAKRRAVAEVSAKDVKVLRDRTGAGMLACRDALTEAEGDVEEAVDILRKRGEAQAAKRAGQQAREG